VTLDPAVPRVHDALKAIADGRGGVNTLVISVRGRESVYVQFSSDPGRLIGGEAVSNTYLDPGEALSPALERCLIEYGWRQPRGDVMNYFREWQIRGSQDTLDIALATVRVLADIYGVVDPDDLVLDVFA
jgi:hypothetical protein